MNTRVDNAVVLKLRQKDCCTYCHRAFGSLVTWHRKNRFLEEQQDHVLPHAIGGRVTVSCCQICNSIKGSLVFDSLAEIQDFCLSRLTRDGSMTLHGSHTLRINRAVERDAITKADINDSCDEPFGRRVEPPLVILETAEEAGYTTEITPRRVRTRITLAEMRARRNNTRKLHSRRILGELIHVLWKTRWKK